MITEIKYLVFNYHALMRVAQHYARLDSTPIPAGSVMEVRLLKQPEIGLEIDYHPMGGRQMEMTKLSTNTLAAAVIRYCTEKEIPTPKEAKKTLEVGGDDLYFKMVKTFEE